MNKFEGLLLISIWSSQNFTGFFTKDSFAEFLEILLVSWVLELLVDF